MEDKKKLIVYYKEPLPSRIPVYAHGRNGKVYDVLPFFGKNKEGRLVLGVFLFEPGTMVTSDGLSLPLPETELNKRSIRLATQILGGLKELHTSDFSLAYNAAFDKVTNPLPAT